MAEIVATHDEGQENGSVEDIQFLESLDADLAREGSRHRAGKNANRDGLSEVREGNVRVFMKQEYHPVGGHCLFGYDLEPLPAEASIAWAWTGAFHHDHFAGQCGQEGL